MFDVGFSELVVLGIVALVVFGPEDLPRVARTIGHLLGKFRRYVADVKSDISHEMETADMKRLYDEVHDSARNVHDAVNEQARALQAEFTNSISGVRQDIEAAAVEPEPSYPDMFVSKPVGEVIPEHDENQLDLFGMPIEPLKTRKD